MSTYLAKYLNILCHLSLDTLPFMLTYFFGGVIGDIIPYPADTPTPFPEMAFCTELFAVVAVVAVVLGPITATAAWNTGGCRLSCAFLPDMQEGD